MAFARLEDFSAPADPANGVIRLETRDQAYTRGYADATQALATDRATDIQTCLAAIKDALDDAAFSAAGARASALASLEPLLREILNLLLPPATRSGLADVIVDTARQAATNGSVLTHISVPPAHCEGVKMALDRAGIAIEVAEDDALVAGQARINAGVGFQVLDCGQAIARITAELDAFFNHYLHEEAANVG